MSKSFNLLFILSLFFPGCGGQEGPSSVETARAPLGAIGPQYVYTVRNQSGKRIRWDYPGGKKFIPPGGCLHYRGFSLSYGVFISYGDQKICGADKGNQTCALEASSTAAQQQPVCGKSGEGFLCPSGGSFDITSNLILKENGRTLSEEDFKASSSSCPMLMGAAAGPPPRRS